MTSTDIIPSIPIKGNSQQQPLRDNWSPKHLEDNIFNDLMENGEIVSQVEEKFERLRLGSTVIEISRKNLSLDTIYHIEESVKHCKTTDEAYQTLNGIIPDVIARIAKQVEHRILAKILSKDQVLLRTSLNNIRELASNHWRFI